MNKYFNFTLSFIAVLLTVAIGIITGHWFSALALLTLFSCAVNQVQARCCTVTLSVPEILKDIVEAFKLQTPELFGAAGFAKDFSSNTAAIGDTITAKIAHVPVTADYDPTPGVGFYSGAQDVTSLIEDVPVTVDRLKHVPVKISLLTEIGARDAGQYKAAVANLGHALGKEVIDAVLPEAVIGCSNSTSLFPFSANVDAFDNQLRAQCNAQKMSNKSRWALISSAYAGELGLDDRARSSLFFNQKNEAEGYRVWKNLGGFNWIREYNDVINAGNEVGGIMGDDRFALVAVRKLQDIENAAKSIGIRAMMKTYPLRDEESGLELCGISWQESGTGDVYLSVAILFGVHCGNGGGAPGTMTDNAGCIIRTV